jgi:hypothetical protein
MAQLSRPYQFGLLGIVLLAAVWLVLLQGHSNSSSTATGSSSPTVQTVTTTTRTAAAKPSSGGSKIYKGSAPGVEGLTKDIAKAEGAVKTSQQNAQALEEKSAAASNESTASSSSSSSSSSSTATHAAPTPAKAVTGTTSAGESTATSAPKANHAKTTKPASAKANSSAPANQKTVEAQLAAGKIALILFWDPRGADDNAVHRAVQELNRSHLKIAVNYAGAGQVATFGSITRGIQVYGTPTLLIVNKKGQTTTLTGLQDGFAIEQAISEARQA